MKKIIIAISLIFVSLTGIFAMTHKNTTQPPAPDGIARLWKDYDAAEKADRPQKQLEILEQIKALAKEQRLPWDFYRAGRRYADVATSRNWKERQKQEDLFQEGIKEFDSAVLTYFNTIYDALGKESLIRDRKAELQAGHNDGFYSADSDVAYKEFSPVLLKKIRNDWEYVLWSIVLNSRIYPEDFAKETRALLSGTLAVRYPEEQFLELVPIYGMDNVKDRFRKKEEFERFADKYRTQAVSLLARQELLYMDFYDLNNANGSKSEQYKALRDRMETFEKDRKAFSSKENDITECCTRVLPLIEALDEKDLYLNIEKGELTVSFRNLDKAGVSIKNGDKDVFSTTLNNRAGSYYTLDTVSMKLPEMNDGDYTAICQNGKIKVEQPYSRYSISMAQFEDAAGYAIFLADARTGEPVKKADIALINDKGKTVAEYKGLVLNGFTYLPDEFTKQFDKDSWKNSIRCSFTDAKGLLHKTRTARLSELPEYGGEKFVENTKAAIYTDRAAFTPGETVKYKILCYTNLAEGGFRVVPEGKQYTVKLLDAQGKEIASQAVKAGEFGSAAGEFTLERRERNGNYRIQVLDRNAVIGSTSIRVDDFVLPTFDLSFDVCESIYFPGDTIDVTGTVKSYSGHSLSSADIRYTVTYEWGTDVIAEGALKAGEDGRFKISFPAIYKNIYSYIPFRIEVKVTDGTGETLEWSTRRCARRHIIFRPTVMNKSKASVTMSEDPQTYDIYETAVVSNDIFNIGFDTTDQEYGRDNNLSRRTMKLSYSLKSGERTIAEGFAEPGEILSIDTSEYPSGVYMLETKASDTDVYGNLIEEVLVFRIIKIKDADTSLGFGVQSVFKVIEGDDIAVQIGTTEGPVWACVELFGSGNKHLGSRMVHLEGKKGSAGSLTTVSFERKPDWEGALTLNVLYFKNYKRYTFSHNVSLHETQSALPLSFTRFLDKTAPASKYSFEIGTAPYTECVAAVFDKSTEEMMRNTWWPIRGYVDDRLGIRISYNVGENGSAPIRMMRAMAAGAVSKAANTMVMAEAAVMDDSAEYGVEIMDYAEEVEEEAIPFQLYSQDGGDIPVREDFANTLAFEPFLRSDANGKIEFNFTTADKLSTYYVQLFAHTKDMSNATIRREMKVTIPVKVSVVEPQFLYVGDRYIVKASLASSIEEPALGTLRADFYDGKDYKSLSPVRTMFKEVELGELQSLSEEFAFEVPDIHELGVKLTFISGNESYGSDAVFVSIPVYPAVQTLTEAHSSILHDGESLEALLSALKSEFVNTSAEGAEMKDISVLQMVKDAIPSKIETSSEDAIAVSEALYVRLLARKLDAEAVSEASDAELLEKILGCKRGDGGFSWFAGMDSSPIVTATLLQRYASLRDRGIIEQQNCGIPYGTVVGAVKYLDKVFFGDRRRPQWCGGISWEQYVSTRAMFGDVEFSSDGIDKDVWKEFRKEIKEYLTPGKERGLNGYILGKARRMKALMDLSGNGIKLAQSWGIKFGAASKLRNSLNKDLLSLQEYAAGHKSGGYYYPNSVMPFRGLLESEAYAHSFIADLLRACNERLEGTSDKETLNKSVEIADGICLWLMVQKETQKWDEDAAFVDAISSILDASEETRNLRVITLSKTFTKPFSDVRASGNGFSIERKYFIEKTENGKVENVALAEGQTLNVGDKIVAEYRIWNEENRSFVKVSAPRMASLRPVEQLSGRAGWHARPLNVDGWYTVSPQGYRSVLKDRTEYWYDSYPEESTTIREEFFVTQTGSFQSPAVSIESLYAPHYRANDSGK
ncbi:MAG: MG2 domain-containing protein [Bacteroidia bacterium]|nr:MG2 domain-containing protein [Bacteroidia bacterium]